MDGTNPFSLLFLKGLPRAQPCSRASCGHMKPQSTLVVIYFRVPWVRPSEYNPWAEFLDQIPRQESRAFDPEPKTSVDFLSCFVQCDLMSYFDIWVWYVTSKSWPNLGVNEDGIPQRQDVGLENAMRGGVWSLMLRQPERLAFLITNISNKIFDGP